ncbi:hypothetical protein H072_963 [Dactylellina haptotyla CBS 200.50]|uniref:Uncharacterized protein n=1 Tax=Dactylellina haptotyla (strain CBS 200.50) TaxID=1284197 RepID=S8APZ6_DACHA|nr:hypothetical protein H072_963 [Dactylellina haptotyla CBS 200.50]
MKRVGEAAVDVFVLGDEVGRLLVQDCGRIGSPGRSVGWARTDENVTGIECEVDLAQRSVMMQTGKGLSRCGQGDVCTNVRKRDEMDCGGGSGYMASQCEKASRRINKGDFARRGDAKENGPGETRKREKARFLDGWVGGKELSGQGSESAQTNTSARTRGTNGTL